MRQQIMHVGLGLGLAATAAAAVTSKCGGCKETITRDVVVIGGGASGAHAAVWLRDNGQSVVVVEKADQLVSPPTSSRSLLAFPFLSPFFSTPAPRPPLFLSLTSIPGWPHQLLQ